MRDNPIVCARVVFLIYFLFIVDKEFVVSANLTNPLANLAEEQLIAV
jgi:hypothetical protein